jgi:hypothetical protein
MKPITAACFSGTDPSLEAETMGNPSLSVKIESEKFPVLFMSNRTLVSISKPDLSRRDILVFLKHSSGHGTGEFVTIVPFQKGFLRVKFCSSDLIPQLLVMDEETIEFFLITVKKTKSGINFDQKKVKPLHRKVYIQCYQELLYNLAKVAFQIENSFCFQPQIVV